MPESYDVVHDAARIAWNRAAEARRETEPDHAASSRRIAVDAEHGAEQRSVGAQRPGFSTADRHPDTAWQRLVGSHLCAIGAELEDALAASDRHDWAAVLEAVRLIQGRAVVTRGLLERRLGPSPVGVDLPPLVHAVQVVRLLITEGEIESLPPDELRVRMHAVLEALDHELRVLVPASD